MAARPSWRGHLKLSLVTCPVALYNAISPAGDVHFHLINPDTKHRVRMVTIDATTDEILDRKDLLKGFEFAKGKYVTLTNEEINSVRLESTKTIDIDKFVPAEEIDRLYWAPIISCPMASWRPSPSPSSAPRWSGPSKWRSGVSCCRSANGWWRWSRAARASSPRPFAATTKCAT
ncbi:MAG TPA: Ku protein [Vitreimonas sp.]|nr:Ku protein [Vitreimonas sp.]HYD86870.1 Ku protein [Vitreimonas sp.]